ncbi:MAG: tetratricopeptide repeat protein, partial [Terriglobales bacterium]
MAQIEIPHPLRLLLTAGCCSALISALSGGFAHADQLKSRVYPSSEGSPEDQDHSLWARYNIAGRRALLKADYKRAEFDFKLAMIEAQKSGKDDVRLAATLNNVAELKRCQGHYKEAERIFKESLAIKEKLLGAESLSVANT